MAGVKAVHVPFKAAIEALTGLLGGQDGKVGDDRQGGGVKSGLSTR